MNKKKILATVNRNSRFIYEVGSRERVVIKIGGKNYVFVRNKFLGGFDVFYAGKIARLKLKGKRLVFVE
jgi:hypothetical protein